MATQGGLFVGFDVSTRRHEVNAEGAGEDRGSDDEPRTIPNLLRLLLIQN